MSANAGGQYQPNQMSRESTTVEEAATGVNEELKNILTDASANPSSAVEDPQTMLSEGMNWLQRYSSVFTRECERVERERLLRPGHGAIDIHQPIRTLGELKTDVMNAMNDTLNNWIEPVDHLNVLPHMLLPQLFKECLKEVKAHHRDITAVLFPTGKTTETMRNHLLQHHRELFHLVPGDEQNKALTRILKGVNDYLRRFPFPEEKVYFVVWETHLGVLAHAYRRIIVNVLLQDPPVTFSNDCGRVLGRGSFSPPTPSPEHGVVPTYDGLYETDVWPFDPNLQSAHTVDSNPPRSELYLVVFPAIVIDGKTPLTMSFTLGYHFKQPQQRKPDTSSTDAGAQVGHESSGSFAQKQIQAAKDSEPSTGDQVVVEPSKSESSWGCMGCWFRRHNA
ncbi:unnamed protein product [Ectocarpus sp. 12 AP-2014]